MMEEILRRLEEELGASLLVENSWNELRAYVKCITGTVVSQKDLRDLLDLLRKSAQQAQEALEAQASEPIAETSLSEDQEPFPESETDDRYNNSNGVDMESEPISGSHLHPRHQSSVYPRPRGASIRKISLSESSSSQYRPYHSHSRVSHGPSEDELDGSEYRVSFSRVSPFICLDCKLGLTHGNFFSTVCVQDTFGGISKKSCRPRRELSGCGPK